MTQDAGNKHVRPASWPRFAGFGKEQLPPKPKYELERTDHVLLARYDIQDRDSDIRADALDRLTEQKVLSQIAARDKDSYVRDLASSRLSSLRSAGQISPQ